MYASKFVPTFATTESSHTPDQAISLIFNSPNGSSSASKKYSNSSKIKHQLMYKTPPNWVKSYREKCKVALTQRRHERQAKLIEGFRNINNQVEAEEAKDKDILVQNLMQSVWHEFMNDPNVDFDREYEHYESQVKPYLEDIEEDLNKDNFDLQTMEANFFDNLKSKEDQEQIEWSLSTLYSVVCFFCQRNYLSIQTCSSGTRIFCEHCLFFDLCVNVQFTGDQLNKRIQYLLDEHKQIECNRLIKFKIPSQKDNVLCFCLSCNYSKFVF